MTNKELMNFKFVDRSLERNSANSYLHNKQKSILAIFGKDKAGKDYFIDQIEKENKELDFIVFNFKEILINPIKSIMYKLYEHNNNAFMSFIKKNYKKVIKSSCIIIDSVAKTKFTEIFNCLNDKECTFVSSNDYHEAPISVVCKYIKETAKYENIVIVFKNITSCEKLYVHDLFELIATIYNYEKTNVRFIISYDEDIYNNNDVFNEYLIKYQYIPINIEKFSDSKFFLEILKEIFDITAKDRNYLMHLFNICDGYPGKLKAILDKAYKISYKSFEGESNIYFDETLIEKAINLMNKTMELTSLEKIILTVVSFIEFDLQYKDIVEIVSFILDKLHISDLDISIEKALQNLLLEKPLLEYKYLPGTEFQYIKFDSNSNKDLYMSVCKNNNIFPQLSLYIFLFISENKDKFINDLDRYNANRAFFSWQAQSIDWIEINYEVGQYFYDKNELSLSENIFLRISKYISKLKSDQILKVLLCFYNSGNYKVSYEIVTDKSAMNINDYNYLLLKIKILNINMEKDKAVSLIDSMLEKDEYAKHTVELLDIKQRILSNIKQRRAEAKFIFDELLYDFSSKKTTYDDFLISSMEYYRGNNVQKNFEILEKKFRKNEDFLMLGELLTNKGFDLFWQGRIQEAMDTFNESNKILEKLRIHETSYTLNNYANCLMMLGDYKKAIDKLISALLLNESSYAKITIKTNLMVCYAIVEDQSYKKLFKELKQYLIENQSKNIDISISLKVKYALGFVQEYLNISEDLKKHENFCEEAKKEASLYDPETLPYLWFKDWKVDVETDISKRLDKEKFTEFYDLRFEPWLLTITHD